MSDKPKILRSRQTLKNYFSAGALPEEQHFHDLIDSTLNMEDEGFNKTPEDGLRVVTETSAEGAAGRSLLSFFREGEEASGPRWRIQFDRGADSLQIVHRPDEEATEEGSRPSADEGSSQAEPPPLLSLAPGRRLGVNQPRPEADLDVGGLVRSRARTGVVPEGVDPETVRADGDWHRITGPLTGCQALEVVAGAGGVPGEGNWALIHAVALNAYQPQGFFQRLFGWKNRIRAHHAWHRSRADKLKLRWTGEPGEYFLEVKTRREYSSRKGEPPPRIIFHLTRLWHHPTMRALEEIGGGTTRDRTRDTAAPGTTPASAAGSEANAREPDRP